MVQTYIRARWATRSVIHTNTDNVLGVLMRMQPPGELCAESLDPPLMKMHESPPHNGRAGHREGLGSLPTCGIIAGCAIEVFALAVCNCLWMNLKRNRATDPPRLCGGQHRVSVLKYSHQCGHPSDAAWWWFASAFSSRFQQSCASQV